VSRYLLDTNAWILLLKQPPAGLRSRLHSHLPNRIVVCSVVKAELWHGAHKYQNAEQRRSVVESLLSPYASLPFDDAAARRYADIRHQLEVKGQLIGPNDLQIAAICLANDLTLVSTNTGEFGRVPGLKVEDWTKGQVSQPAKET
jgi:tRNA(fMet)-specific endonuclease VapC